MRPQSRLRVWRIRIREARTGQDCSAGYTHVQTLFAEGETRERRETVG
jgi:hypothetical protein